MDFYLYFVSTSSYKGMQFVLYRTGTEGKGHHSAKPLVGKCLKVEEMR